MNKLSLSDITQLVTNLKSKTDFLPFDSKILEFCQKLSQILTTDKQLRPYPDVVALGYWLRTSHIQQLKTQFEKSTQVRLAPNIYRISVTINLRKP